eukprot:1802684-Amphidinium_carterae.2
MSLVNLTKSLDLLSNVQEVQKGARFGQHALGKIVGEVTSVESSMLFHATGENSCNRINQKSFSDMLGAATRVFDSSSPKHTSVTMGEFPLTENTLDSRHLSDLNCKVDAGSGVAVGFFPQPLKGLVVLRLCVLDDTHVLVMTTPHVQGDSCREGRLYNKRILGRKGFRHKMGPFY